MYKRTGKHAVIVKQDADKKDNKESNNKDDKKAEGGGGGGDKDKKGGDEAATVEAGKEANKDKKEGENEAGGDKGGAVVEENTLVELKKNELLSHYMSYNYDVRRYAMESDLYYDAYAPPPQMFSDENPNACSVM